MKHCKSCRRDLELTAYEAEYKTCTECRNKKSCTHCEYKCTSAGNLQNHIATTHLKQQNFQCPNCDSKFGLNSNLKVHIKNVHLKEQNYQCDQCKSKFSTQDYLQRHINTVHLKQKNFQCLTCAYKCGSKINLQKHIKICTGELKCPVGEYKILKLLEKLNYEKDIDFLHNTSYWNVRDKGLLRWDFVINHTSDNPQVLEYDGSQHFKPVSFGGCSVEKAQENFETSQRRDKIKNDYCKENNIPILRISYLDIDNIETLISGFLV